MYDTLDHTTYTFEFGDLMSIFYTVGFKSFELVQRLNSNSIWSLVVVTNAMDHPVDKIVVASRNSC